MCNSTGTDKIFFLKWLFLKSYASFYNMLFQRSAKQEIVKNKKQENENKNHFRIEVRSPELQRRWLPRGHGMDNLRGQKPLLWSLSLNNSLLSLHRSVLLLPGKKKKQLASDIRCPKRKSHNENSQSLENTDSLLVVFWNPMRRKQLRQCFFTSSLPYAWHTLQSMYNQRRMFDKKIVNLSLFIWCK